MEWSLSSLPQNFISPKPMRNVINPQMLLDGVDISAIDLSTKSRDDIPQLLRGLQHIYTEPGLRERVFSILQEVIPNRTKGEGKADAGSGRREWSNGASSCWECYDWA